MATDLMHYEVFDCTRLNKKQRELLDGPKVLIWQRGGRKDEINHVECDRDVRETREGTRHALIPSRNLSFAW